VDDPLLPRPMRLASNRATFTPAAANA
jgi:hypothetical protein